MPDHFTPKASLRRALPLWHHTSVFTPSSTYTLLLSSLSIYHSLGKERYLEGVRCGGMMSIDSTHVYLELAKKDNMYHTIVYAINPRVNKW